MSGGSQAPAPPGAAPTQFQKTLAASGMPFAAIAGPSLFPSAFKQADQGPSPTLGGDSVLGGSGPGPASGPTGARPMVRR